MNEDRRLLAQVEDKIEQCSQRNYATNTGFLDMHQQSVIRNALKHRPLGCEVTFCGGYDSAERAILLCLPNWLAEEDAEPLSIIRATRTSRGGRKLSHRDYLGSLVGLGIRRDVIGDILVREDGADIIVLADIAPFIQQEYSKAGRVELSVEERPIRELIQPPKKTKLIGATLASLRLDNVVSAGFSIPRSKAVEAIQSGLVFQNQIECNKPDRTVQEGDLITLRRSGRIRLLEVGGLSRKNRVYVSIERF